MISHDLRYVLCVRPNARETLGEALSGSGAGAVDAAAPSWDDDCVRRQLGAYRVREVLLSAARPAASVFLPYSALASHLQACAPLSSHELP